MESDDEEEYEEAGRSIQTGLNSEILHLAKKNEFLLQNIDSIVELSRGNTIVKEVELYPFDGNAENYEFWDKVGQIVGNLTKLEMLSIVFHPYIEEDDDSDHDDDDPDWEILARILPYLRRKVELSSSTENYDATVEEIAGLARAIHGHPMISAFSSEMRLTLVNLASWCYALATLPSLESVVFSLREHHYELAHLEPFAKVALTELLRVPSLRFFLFYGFTFTNTLCHATANAIEAGLSIVDITFDNRCEFPCGGRAIIANALKKNASVTNVKFLDDCDEPLCSTLAAVLLSNATLQNLTVHNSTRDSGRWFSSIFLSLGMNTSLKSLTVKIRDKFGDELCAAITSGLAKNTALEFLSLHGILTSDDDGAISARNALSFLRTNSTLKSLTVSFVQAFNEVEEHSYFSPFRMEAMKMMEENSCLESLIVTTGYNIKFEELLALVSVLKRNTTLKYLGFQSTIENFSCHLWSTEDEFNQLASILIKNYGLERLVPDVYCEDAETVEAILRLNGAGRRYLIKDGSSISKGVEVLSAVSDDINCLFLHLLENPGLCNKRAVDATTRSRRQGANLDESSSSGKRELAQSQSGKEPRRRLA
jgi:hypothetical protein